MGVRVGGSGSGAATVRMEFSNGGRGYQHKALCECKGLSHVALCLGCTETRRYYASNHNKWIPSVSERQCGAERKNVWQVIWDLARPGRVIVSHVCQSYIGLKYTHISPRTLCTWHSEVLGGCELDYEWMVAKHTSQCLSPRYAINLNALEAAVTQRATQLAGHAYLRGFGLSYG